MKNILFISVLFLTQLLFSQQITTESVIKKFAGKSSVEWAIPVSQTEKIAIHWQERISSFTQSEGIRSFMGYHNGELVGSLSFVKNSIIGEFSWQDQSYQMKSNGNILNIIVQNQTKKCGTCTEKGCHYHEKTPLKVAKFTTEKLSEETELIIPNDEVLRIFRLALPVSYGVFSGNSQSDDFHAKGFDSDVEKVKLFWADTETRLNELYMKDIGIKFEIVNDERLIIKDRNSPDNELEYKDGWYIILHSTQKINKLIGSKNYDVGVFIINPSSSEQGKADLFGALIEGKGAAFAQLDFEAIAHEMGHLFGSLHTHAFGQSNGLSYMTEAGGGQSIMSYGKNRTFFSLVSAYYIRRHIFARSYYSDKARTQLQTRSGYSSNYPYAEKVKNNPPKIDKTNLKETYTLPKNTNFQFKISASDPEGMPLWYMAHPANIEKGELAKFATLKPSRNNIIAFQPEYTDNGYYEQYTNFDTPEGSYVFWLGVSDAQIFDKTTNPHYLVQYDKVQTQVNIVSGDAFEITTHPKKQYKQGEKIHLKWKVDKEIFKNTRVRILLSDDFGKTYSHTLVSETDNDGEEWISLPNISIGKVDFGKKWKTPMPAGIIKIEVIDHIAFATTNRIPFEDYNGQMRAYGGFEISSEKAQENQPLAWAESSLPELKVSCKDRIPAPKNPATQGGKGKVTIKYSDTPLTNYCDATIVRTFTATDDENKPIQIKQLIKVEDKIVPEFIGKLPKNMEIETDTKIPNQADLTATDNCSTNVKVEKFKSEESGKVIYKWVAEDICGNIAEYSQIITIKEKAIPPIVWVENSLPKNEKVSCENIPAVATNLQANGGCSTLTISHKSDEITNRTCANSYQITRIYEAKDTCGNSKNYTQIIEVEDKTAPTFVGELPENKEILEGQPLPEQLDLIARDNCSTNVKVEKSFEDISENGKLVKRIYKWVAKDDCGNEITHTQTITIKEKAHSDLPKTPEIPNNPKTPKNSNLLIYNGVSLEEGSENYFRLEGIDEKTTISVEIFNELGQKVFQSINYGQKGEVFRGYPNVKGVFNPSKRLPTGTYFYILKYEDKSKSGYLFVK